MRIAPLNDKRIAIIIMQINSPKDPHIMGWRRPNRSEKKVGYIEPILVNIHSRDCAQAGITNDKHDLDYTTKEKTELSVQANIYLEDCAVSTYTLALDMSGLPVVT